MNSQRQRSSIVLALVAFWALRLSAYITWRNWGEGEDARYQAMRRKHSPNFAVKSLFIVFLLQGFLAWIIALPLLAAITGSRPLNLLDGLAVVLVLFGTLFESIADAQLAAFKARPDNSGPRHGQRPVALHETPQLLWRMLCLVGVLSCLPLPPEAGGRSCHHC